MENYCGIDYGMGLSNIDTITGIRYGVIAQGSLWNCGSDVYFEGAVYLPVCPECGCQYDEKTDAIDIEKCIKCGFKPNDYSEFYPDEPSYIDYQDTENNISIEGCLDTDYIITKSNYYTFAPYCSPCVPGAGNLDDTLGDGSSGIKCYCVPADYFDDYTPCPYPIWRVSDDKQVYTPQA